MRETFVDPNFLCDQIFGNGSCRGQYIHLGESDDPMAVIPHWRLHVTAKLTRRTHRESVGSDYMLSPVRPGMTPGGTDAVAVFACWRES